MWQVKDEFTRRRQASKIILVPQSDFILELSLSVEILFKWYLCVQLDMKEEVFLQVSDLSTTVIVQR